MSIGFAYGFCSLCGLAYGPLHNIIPFLLLGIGIDDMFVIMQCWDNLFSSGDKATKEIPLAKRIGKTMKHAGVAITVTSATDMVAFAVGSVTVSEGREEKEGSIKGKRLVTQSE